MAGIDDRIELEDGDMIEQRKTFAGHPAGNASSRGMDGVSPVGSTFPDRAAAEVAPRDVNPGTAPRSAGTGMGHAVDENRPADVLATDGLMDMSRPDVRPNVLQKQHAVVAEDQQHPKTPGEELV